MFYYCEVNKMRKVYVKVNADHSPDGKVTPNYFLWENGHRYEIDRVLDIRRAASLRAGGIGLRYTIRVLGKQTYMWLEDSSLRWFMETK